MIDYQKKMATLNNEINITQNLYQSFLDAKTRSGKKPREWNDWFLLYSILSIYSILSPKNICSDQPEIIRILTSIFKNNK